MRTYQFSSAVTRFGPILTPEKLIINDQFVIWSQNKGATSLFLASSKIIIPRNTISAIELDGGLVGTDVYIFSFGGQHIRCKNFTISDAKAIKHILTSQP